MVDKEAGLIAMDAFLALYDATRDPHWLECAEQAAAYSATWLYCWNVPMVEGDAGSDFPKGCGTVGLSLIATGHSGADTFMAYYPFAYLRLYLYTGKDHYRDIARLLLNGTKQIQDLEGRLGYAKKGLQTEAMSVAVTRGHSVGLWLPWLTVACLDPIVELRDTFGGMNLEEVEKLGVAELRRRNEAYGRSRGLTRAPDSPKQNTRQNWQYLDELQETDSSVGHGVVGKHGTHGYGDAVVSLGGTKQEHALSLHPPRKGRSYATYSADRKWKSIRATVGISDAAPKQAASDLTFMVKGDGKVLWQSRPIRQKGDTVACEVPITEVSVLTLEVRCTGDNGWAFAVWGQPQVFKK